MIVSRIVARSLPRTKDCHGRWAGVTASYTFGTQRGGWGVSFWLPPGGYAIQLMSLEFPDAFYLSGKYRQEFRGFPGDTVRITFELNLSDPHLFAHALVPDRESCTARLQWVGRAV